MQRLLSFACAALLSIACGRTPTAPAKKPATSEPGRVTLTPEAEVRLGIPEGLVKVARQRFPARRVWHPNYGPSPYWPRPPNLLDNACKYCPEGGTITVSLGFSLGSLEIVVRDSGPGMSADDLAHACGRKAAQPCQQTDG